MTEAVSDPDCCFLRRRRRANATTNRMARTTAPPIAAPTMTPVERGLAVEEASEGLVVVAALGDDEGAGVMSDVAGIEPVSGGTSDVDGEEANVSESEVVVVGLPVMMVVCLVTVTMELLGMVWVMPESVMVADFLEVGVGRDEVDSSLCPPRSSSSVGVGVALSGSEAVLEGM